MLTDSESIQNKSKLDEEKVSEPKKNENNTVLFNENDIALDEPTDKGDYITKLRFTNNTERILDIKKLKIYIKENELKEELFNRSSFGPSYGLDYFLLSLSILKNNIESEISEGFGDEVPFKEDLKGYNFYNLMKIKKNILNKKDTLIITMAADVSINLSKLKLTYVVEYDNKILKEYEVFYK